MTPNIAPTCATEFPASSRLRMSTSLTVGRGPQCFPFGRGFLTPAAVLSTISLSVRVRQPRPKSSNHRSEWRRRIDGLGVRHKLYARLECFQGAQQGETDLAKRSKTPDRDDIEQPLASVGHHAVRFRSAVLGAGHAFIDVPRRWSIRASGVFAVRTTASPGMVPT
jgi:hypothetical protein